MIGKIFTRIKLKRLQLPGHHYMNRNKWLRFTVRYFLIRYLGNGGGTLQIRAKCGEMLLVLVGDRTEIGKMTLTQH
jgi:hypothetical protein